MTNNDISYPYKSFDIFVEDDVWIGRGVFIMSGKKIKKGSILAAGTVLTKNFPEYSIIGGNPSRLIKSRKNNDSIFY